MVQRTGNLNATLQYAGEHGCRSYVGKLPTGHVCMKPETVIHDGRMYCDQHRPEESKQASRSPFREHHPDCSFLKSGNEQGPHDCGPEPKTPGQLAYEEDVRRQPNYGDTQRGTWPRESWSGLSEIARDSWERNPTPRNYSRRQPVEGSVAWQHEELLAGCPYAHSRFKDSMGNPRRWTYAADKKGMLPVEERTQPVYVDAITEGGVTRRLSRSIRVF